MREQLSTLAEHFDRLERPALGRYAKQPAVADENGVVMLPPDPLPAYLAGAGARAAAAAIIWTLSSHHRTAANTELRTTNS